MTPVSAPSPFRVASRFLFARDWGDPDSILQAFHTSLTNFRKTYEAFRDNPYNGGVLSRAMVPVIHSGRPLAEWVIQTRAIPAGRTKDVELAARVIGSMRKLPRDIPQWYDNNNVHLGLLLEAATWGDRSTGTSAGGEIATVAPFKVHNTIGADAKQFKEIQGLVKSAVTSLNTTRDFKKVLYGDVFVVGQLRQSRTLAWYSVQEDDVYVRSLAKKGFDDLHSLVHELGHRYWFKFATAGQKKAVHTLFVALSYASSPRMPKAGDTLPVPLRGVKVPPVITKQEGLFYHLSTGGRVKVLDVMKILKVTANFPTQYSSKNVDEFFAECFAFYTLGRLKPDLSAKFESALG